MHLHMQNIDQQNLKYKQLQSVIVMLRGIKTFQFPNAFSNTKAPNRHKQVEPSKCSIFIK